jgi:hypothetical protein
VFKNAGKINEYKIMKAFFIFKDGELVGSPIGYTTEKGARKSLVGSEDWCDELYKYDYANACPNAPQELIDMGLYEWSEYTNSYLFNREAWSRKIWNKYFNEHYKIIEKEFDIVFKD